MFPVTPFRTIHDMITPVSHNMPHALVQEWWSRLERVIRIFGQLYGAAPRERVSIVINKHLRQHPLVTPALVQELHRMRDLRNRCAHGESPSLTVEESSAFAYRAWDIQSALAWNNPQFLSEPSGLPSSADLPAA